MSRPEPRLARAYRILSDFAIGVGVMSLVYGIIQAARSQPIENTIPWLVTAAIAGLIAVAAAIVRRRYTLRLDELHRAE